jgi:hypothetical protein
MVASRKTNSQPIPRGKTSTGAHPSCCSRRKIHKKLQSGVAAAHCARLRADFCIVSLRFGLDAESCANASKGQVWGAGIAPTGLRSISPDFDGYRGLMTKLGIKRS